MQTVSRWLPVLLYCTLIAYLSSQTGSELPRFSWMKHDKVLHTLEYSGLGFLFCRALFTLSGWRRVVSSAALGLAFGLTDEFHQSFVPGRQGNDPGDMSADLLGSALGAVGFVVLLHLIRKIKMRREPA